MELIKGQEFKNFKALCVYMGWIDKDKILSTGSKRKLEKDLSQICCWEKSNGSNRIVIKEIYESKKKRLDGRNSRNKYVKSIEKIMLYTLGQASEELFISKSSIGKILELYNSKFFKDGIYYKELAESMCIDRFLIMFFLMESRSEISKIISRAMDSMFKSNVLIGEKGIIIHCRDGKCRIANEEEEEKIKNIEKEVLEQLCCKTKAVVYIKNNNKLFMQEVNKRLSAEGMEYIKNYYQGYYIESFDRLEAKSIDDNDAALAKEDLKKEVIERLIYIGGKTKERIIKEEYEKTLLGEPMLIDVRCNKDFAMYWEELIGYFLLQKEEIDQVEVYK